MVTIVTVVINTVLYYWNLPRESTLSSLIQKKKLTVWGDGWAN